MEPGRLRHRVVIEQSTLTADALGQAVEAWTTYATMWAEIKPLKGRQLEAAQAANSEVTARVTMRYVSGVSPKWRLRHGTTVYRIVGEIINPNMMNKTLEFMVTQQPQVTA